MPIPYKIFVIYAREDSDYLQELLGHLGPLERSKQVIFWSDREINPGVEWEKEIIDKLDNADIILVLVSSAYYSSSYIHGIEIARAYDRHKKGLTHLLPIIIRPVVFKEDPIIGSLQMLPTEARPVNDRKFWLERDDAWVVVANEIKSVVTKLVEKESAEKERLDAIEHERLEMLPKNRLLKLINSFLEGCKLSRNHDIVDKLNYLIEKFENESFKLAIIGGMKRGKSTFINAILGKEILPSFTYPSKQYTTILKYGITPKAIAYFKDPIERILIDTIPDYLRDHIKNNYFTKVPPLLIPVQELKNFMEYSKENSSSFPNSSYLDRIELFWPLNILKNDVELVVFPCIDYNEYNEFLSKQNLQFADGIIFILNSFAMFSEYELRYINEQLKPKGHNNIIFIINRMDQIRIKEIDRVTNFAKLKIKTLTNLQNEMFFLSSRDALDGKIEKQSGLIDKSGILPFELFLKDYLKNPRKRKLLLVVSIFKNLILEVRKNLGDELSKDFISDIQSKLMDIELDLVNNESSLDI